jgi:hypothetical protein
MGCDFVAVILCRYATSANSNYTQFTSKISDFIVN